MMKWSLLGVGAAWASAILYEYTWSGGRWNGRQAPWQLFLLAAGVFLCGVAWSWVRSGWLPRTPRPRLWFALAAVVCGAFLVALDRTVAKGLPYVPMLPMYPILFLDFLASGCYTWWRRRRKLK